MIRSAVIGGALAVGLAIAPALAQDRAEPKSAEFKVVFWFDGNTWRSQAYNLGKGQYTKAVEAWVNKVEVDELGFVQPSNLAFVKTIRVETGPGQAEREQLAKAIEQEFRKRRWKGPNPDPIPPGYDPPRFGRPASPLYSGGSPYSRAGRGGSAPVRTYISPGPAVARTRPP